MIEGRNDSIMDNRYAIINKNRETENGNMDIIQTFYDRLASEYDKLFLDWQATTHEQAVILDSIFRRNGFDRTADILDCACGIGTQSIGLAALGYRLTASDISDAELAEAKKRAAENNVSIQFAHADFRALSESFSQTFDIIICMDNALPHMLSGKALETAIQSITNQLTQGGLFVASIRDYDALLTRKPPYSPPYIHKTDCGQRVSFQTWDWEGDHYKLVQYIIDDGNTLQVSKFPCEYRATRREEISQLLLSCGYHRVQWLFPDETGFYQPIVVAKN
jgi:SAM-dependent methyltransferase